MEAEQFLQRIEALGINFYTGVPDSQLAALCDTLYERYGACHRCHIVAANEGGAVGLAAGHYIAAGRPALVYMQNSGLGNAINPIASLLHEQVYGIPCLFVIGWRGEPGVPDEPQHRFQGMITTELLKLMGIESFILGRETSQAQVEQGFARCAALLKDRKCAAVVVKKGALTRAGKAAYESHGSLPRERALEMILGAAGKEDLFVSTTGKTSRELFELRKKRREGHERDFLTVGSMGHALMIALGAAMERPERTVWCMDGDGAAVMHLGGMRLAAGTGCENLIHVILNNAAHESVGGMPVAGGVCEFAPLAESIGYSAVFRAEDEGNLAKVLPRLLDAKGIRFLEIKTALASRADLGRPTVAPRENLEALRGWMQ